PPPGRSMGVISFIGNNYGFIEREDLKKFSFSFDAYFGNRDHIVPGVKVHFTAVKELGRECATDVKVAPGGTEDIEATVYEGVVTTVLPDTYVMDPYPGRIRTILSTDPIKLPFGKTDSKTTLLLFDRVKFQLLTDIITKINRATNIIPQIPETFQLTKEIRETGIITNIKDAVCTIMSEKHENLTASVSDSLLDSELKAMDEVEFTALSVKDTVKAIRLKKLLKGSVIFDTQTKNKIAEVKEKATNLSPAKDKWKPVSSVLTTEGMGVNEDISSEKYEGAVFQVVPRNFKEAEQVEEHKLTQGLLDSMVEGTQKRLPFRSSDVITQATMMVGDRVYFNISTNPETKEERAVNIKIQPDTLQSESEEQRKIGIIVKLDESSGFIKTPQDPELFFNLSEIMDDIKLIVGEKVEFTLAATEGGEEDKQAIRIRKLTESVFTSVPKLEALGEKEKKKMTIRLLRDPKEQIKKEGKNSDLLAAVKQEKGKVETSKAVKLPKGPKQEIIGKQEKLKGKVDRERSKSRESSRHRYSWSRSLSRDRSSSYYRRHRSSSRERRSGKYRRSRSRSKERLRRYGHSYSHSHSRSRSRSRERIGRSGKKRSRSPEHRDEHCKGQSSSKEHSSKRRSRSPDNQTEALKKKNTSSFMDPSHAETVDDELTKKRKELLELNELIARKRAIIAMEQNTKSFKDVLEMDRQHGFATFDYQHKTCLENTWNTDVKPVKSILKKHSEPQMDPKHQVSKRSVTPEEPVGYPVGSDYNFFGSASSVPAWIVQSSTTEIEDQELVWKKRQLDELSESIARKRAIMAMEQKEDLDITVPNENTWRLDIKPDLQPKKSILKKRTEPLTDQPQSDISSSDQYGYSRDLFSISKPPQDDYSALLKPLMPSHTSLEKSTNLTPVPCKNDNLFKRLINEVSTTSRMGENLTFNHPPGHPSVPRLSNSGSFYDQKSTRESKAGYSHEDTGSTSYFGEHQFCHQARDQSSISAGPSTPSSASDQKRNLTTQMQRFLSALNKADPNLLSSLFREARKDSVPVGSLKNPQLQADRNVPSKDELYDPFKGTENSEANSLLMGSKAGRIPALEQAETCSVDYSQDDLLPHERAVQDGSGFSKIVGMKYGTDPKVENRFLYGDKAVSHGNFSKEQKQFLDQSDRYELHRDHYPFEHQNLPSKKHEKPHSHVRNLYTENRERYERQIESERYKVESSLSPLHQKSQDTSECVDKKTEHYEKLQNLLQTIGLSLDTAEVSKLTDRTRERLYGKKVKPQSASTRSFEKDEQSTTRYDRKGSRADSTDSEDVRSVSPARSSNREVYLSYLDSVRHRDNCNEEVAVVKEREKDLVSLKRTIKNSPEARQVIPDQYKLTSPLTNVKLDSYKTMEPLSPSAQSLGSFYTQISTESSSTLHYHKGRQDSWENSYPMDKDQKGNSQALVSPYGAIPPVLLHYAAGNQGPPPHVPPGYGAYTPPVNPLTIMPPSPELYPVFPPFCTRTPFGPPLTPTFQPPTGQFDMSIQPGGSGYDKLQTKIKPAAPTRCLKTIETVKTKEPFSVKPALLNVQPALISIQTIEDTQPKDVQEEAESKKVAPITEDDIKAKQKKRLEQFNQRMKLKKEQMEAQRTRGQSQKSAPGLLRVMLPLYCHIFTGRVTRKEVKNVWICGHSLVFWAEKRATSPEIGMQLGMDPNSVRIWWKGVQGMTWQQLLPQLLQLKDNWPKPDVILMHLGGNDIGKITVGAFLAAVKKDLISMKSIFPQCLLVWSDILPRRSWRHSDDSKAVDNTRKAMNNSIHSIITELGGSSLTHENIMPGLDTGLYRPDGVHLSGKGIDTFNLNMQDFLEKWESDLSEMEPSEI
ncbi:hypothetical protein P4O66_013480, partial [Electrophorus voltai]